MSEKTQISTFTCENETKMKLTVFDSMRLKYRWLRAWDIANK